MTGFRPAAKIRRLKARQSPPARAALALALSLALAGCATRRIEPVLASVHPLRPATLDEVLQAYERHCKGLETLSASGDLDVKDLRAGRARKLGVRLVATRGGRLYIKGNFLLVTALEVISNGERFWFQVPSKKTVWTGASGAQPFAEGEDKAPYYALRPRDVAAALLPEPLAPEAGDGLTLEGDREGFCLALSRMDGDGRGLVRRRIFLDRETLKPTRSRAYDERGDLVSEVTFGGYVEGIARRVVVSRPAEGYVADFLLNKAEANQQVPERAFEPRTPPGYKVVEVEAP